MSSTNRCAKSTFLAFLLAMSSTFAVGHPKLASSTPANASEVTAPPKRSNCDSPRVWCSHLPAPILSWLGSQGGHFMGQ